MSTSWWACLIGRDAPAAPHELRHQPLDQRRLAGVLPAGDAEHALPLMRRLTRDPLGVGIDREPVVAHEGDERDAGLLGGLDGERCRRRYGRDRHRAEGGGLLHHLVGAAAGHHDEAAGAGRARRRASAPPSLSSALCRPTSSRTATSVPSAGAQPGGMGGAVHPVDALLARQRRHRPLDGRRARPMPVEPVRPAPAATPRRGCRRRTGRSRCGRRGCAAAPAAPAMRWAAICEPDLDAAPPDRTSSTSMS